MNRRNYYRVLHVQPDAPTEIIRMSYLTLMRRLKMHPDLGGDHRKAALINEAFATLVDPVRRAAYDRMLARERVLPGYRRDAAGQPTGPAHAPQPAVVNPCVCPFCSTACASDDLARPDATCTFCESPLYPAARHAHQSSSRRALERMNREIPVHFYLSWPQHSPCQATTEDISIGGMRLNCALDLVPGECIKIECDLCSAIAVVRHAKASGTGGRWVAGVEFLTLRIKPVRGVLVSTRV